MSLGRISGIRYWQRSISELTNVTFPAVFSSSLHKIISNKGLDFLKVTLFESTVIKVISLTIKTYHPFITAQQPEKKVGAFIIRQIPSLSG